MPETYTQRKERERRRDAIRDLAEIVAEHVAGGDLIEYERLDGGEFCFTSGVLEGWRCRCGMWMAPFPTPHSRHGILPTYYCPVCSLPAIVDLMQQIAERVSE